MGKLEWVRLTTLVPSIDGSYGRPGEKFLVREALQKRCDIEPITCTDGCSSVLQLEPPCLDDVGLIIDGCCERATAQLAERILKNTPHSPFTFVRVSRL